MENAIEAESQNIFVTFYRRGCDGLDFEWDGRGIPDKELPHICKCLELRERNEMYKSKSIGYRGEALNSMGKACKLTIYTKECVDSEFGWKVVYHGDGEIESIEHSDEIKPGECGTKV